MFPLRDENPTELTPFLTVALIAANVGVWIWVQNAGFEPDALYASICRYGIIPAELTGRPPDPAAPAVCPPGVGAGWATLVTGMFLHGSWFHLLGNMWFLWLFGNNIEDSMGHGRFLFFYLLTGLAASGAHIWTLPDSPLPTVGASGAVSGVMGAYLILYPRVRVYTLFIIVILIRVLPIPAYLMLLYWLLIQLLIGVTMSPEAGGVAVWAHVGGFIAGVLLVKPFENPELVGARRQGRRITRGQLRGGGWW